MNRDERCEIKICVWIVLFLLACSMWLSIIYWKFNPDMARNGGLLCFGPYKYNATQAYMNYFGGVFIWSVFAFIRVSLYLIFGNKNTDYVHPDCKWVVLKYAMLFHDYLSVPFFVCYVYGYGIVVKF